MTFHAPRNYNVAQRTTGLDRIKRVAGYECEQFTFGVQLYFTKPCIGYSHFDNLEPIVVTGGSLHSNVIIDSELPQEQKVRIPMTGNNAVALPAWHRTRRHMSRTKGECSTGNAGKDDYVYVPLRNAQPCHCPGIGPRPRPDTLFPGKTSVPCLPEQILCQRCLGVDVGATAQLPDSGQDNGGGN